MKKMNNNWFCIYTNAREEQIAFHELLTQGIEIYFPRYKRIVKHARKSQEKIFSLFPRYFFALETEETSFSNIKRTRGVADYIHTYDGSPFRIKQEIIDQIKSREDPNGYIQINNKRFAKGDKVILTKGILSTLNAIFLNQSDSKSGKVLLELLGREHILSTPLDYLDRQ